MARKQDLIDELVGNTEPTIDRSLRGQELRCADQEEIPRTLTAWEWEAYDREHGQPEAHANVNVNVNVNVNEAPRAGWPDRLGGWWLQRRSPK